MNEYCFGIVLVPLPFISPIFNHVPGLFFLSISKRLLFVSVIVVHSSFTKLLIVV